MLRRFAFSALAALTLAAAPALLAQDNGTAAKPKKPAMSATPWPDDDVLLARRTDAEQRRLFQDAAVLDFTLTSEFNLLNKERTPNNSKQFPGVLTVDSIEIPVTLASRGHLRLKSQTCDFVPIRIDLARNRLAGTTFEGQTTLKLGTHCRGESESDQYVLREYLAYKLANLVTPLSFRARLAKGTYIDARTKKKVSTHSALFLEPESDVARRLAGRQVRLPRLMFKDFDKDALTTMMLLEYMLGNTDYSIWALHNVVIVQDKTRRFFPVPYDFDLSGMVHAPYAAPDERLPIKSVTDRLYRGPCRTLDEFSAAVEPFRARKADMLAAIDAVRELDGVHKREMQEYLDSFFRRIDSPQGIKRTFVDGCPATRGRV
jgi:hypothetical protein